MSSSPLAIVTSGFLAKDARYVMARDGLVARGFEVRGLTLPDNGFNDLAADTAAVKRLVDEALEADPERRISLVAHSKGGRGSAMAVEAHLLGGGSSIDRLVTFGTPWKGGHVLKLGAGRTENLLAATDAKAATALLGFGRRIREGGLGAVAGDAAELVRTRAAAAAAAGGGEINLRALSRPHMTKGVIGELAPRSDSTRVVGETLDRLHQHGGYFGFEHHNVTGVSIERPVPSDGVVAEASSFLGESHGALRSHVFRGPEASHAGIIDREQYVDEVYRAAFGH